MKKYYAELVDEGYDELHSAMVDFIVQGLRRQFGKKWLDDAQDALSDQRDLPRFTDEETLIDCLDRANCCRVIQRRCRDLFYSRDTAENCKTWASELMGIRNLTSHAGGNDIAQKDAERYLDTMVRLASQLDKKSAERIKELYLEARSTAPDVAAAAQPEGYYPAADQESAGGAEFDLLSIDDPEIVELTGLSRKLTINGETLAYPVYRVRLDKLFYNDRNDRILTWISQYKDENGVDDLSGLSREEYNRVIEDFIIKSNPASIEKTRNSIRLINQTIPGVTLSDGRIIDGNRRFTCLRMIHREDPSVNYFETVILKHSSADSAKQIKLLELAIQHGEEEKVDYSQIDLVIGAYLDIVVSGLITVEEYAASTNEPIGDVRRKLDIAQLIVEFLDFMHVPGQYHIARDMQVYSIFGELLQLLNKCKSDKEKEELKRSVFTNTMLGTFADQRKYIRDLKGLFGTQPYKTYIQRENKTAEQISGELSSYGVGGMEDLKEFIESKEDVRSELALSKEKAVNQSRKAQTRSKPAKNVGRCIELLMEIDTDIFSKLSDEELAALKAQFAKLSEVTDMIAGELPDE